MITVCVSTLFERSRLQLGGFIRLHLISLAENSTAAPRSDISSVSSKEPQEHSCFLFRNSSTHSCLSSATAAEKLQKSTIDTTCPVCCEERGLQKLTRKHVGPCSDASHAGPTHGDGERWRHDATENKIHG